MNPQIYTWIKISHIPSSKTLLHKTVSSIKAKVPAPLWSPLCVNYLNQIDDDFSGIHHKTIIALAIKTCRLNQNFHFIMHIPYFNGQGILYFNHTDNGETLMGIFLFIFTMGKLTMTSSSATQLQGSRYSF